MASVPNRTPTEPAPAGPNLIALPRPPKPHRPAWVKWVVGTVLVALVAAGGLLWRAHLQNVVQYETVPVERGSVQANVTATGTLNAVVDVLVSSQVSGNIKALYADWNTKVKAGQLVALIDPEIFQAQVDQATATLRSATAARITAEAQLEKAKSDLSGAIATEKSAEANLTKDQANAANAKAQFDRMAALVKEQVMSPQDYDTAKAAADSSQAQVAADHAQIDAANQNVVSAQAEVRVCENQLASAQALERQAEAALRQAQINLDHTRIIAPVDGTVIARRMDVGQTVASSLSPPTIFEIAQDLTKMQVDTNVDESDVGNVSMGQKATFTVDSYPDTLFYGVVADIRKAAIITQNVVTYDVVITVANTDLKLFPGMTANVTISTRRLEDITKVPNAVLRFHPSSAVLKQTGLQAPQPNKQQVYVLRAGKLVVVPVKFGISDGRYTAVTSGELKPGDQVVVRATVGGGTPGTTPTTSMPGAPRM